MHAQHLEILCEVDSRFHVEFQVVGVHQSRVRVRVRDGVRVRVRVRNEVRVDAIVVLGASGSGSGWLGFDFVSGMQQGRTASFG